MVETTNSSIGPKGGWFRALWKRDFPIIKELGANTIRIYNANPTTRLASIQVCLSVHSTLIAPEPRYHT
jgi:hypothetical protein